MMKALSSGAAIALVATACATPFAPAPLAVNFESSTQHKLQAAAHWNVIAADVAARLSARVPANTPLFVNRHADASAFERAFTAQILTALIEAGHPVMRTPEGALRVGVDTQALLDSEFARGATPSMEIIVTTSVTDGNRYVARNTSVYYVEDADQRLYHAPVQAPTKTFQIVGGE